MVVGERKVNLFILKARTGHPLRVFLWLMILFYTVRIIDLEISDDNN